MSKVSLASGLRVDKKQNKNKTNKQKQQQQQQNML